MYSQAVTHPSTNTTQRCLTSVIGRELVLSTWYGRRHSLWLKTQTILNRPQSSDLSSPTGWGMISLSSWTWPESLGWYLTASQTEMIWVLTLGKTLRLGHGIWSMAHCSLWARHWDLVRKIRVTNIDNGPRARECTLARHWDMVRKICMGSGLWHIVHDL